MISFNGFLKNTSPTTGMIGFRNCDCNLFLRLTLKTPITVAGEDIFKCFYYYFSEKLKLDISCEL